MIKVGRLIWDLQDLKREEKALRNAETLKLWVSKLKALQGQIREKVSEAEVLQQKITVQEKNIKQMEQEFNQLVERINERKEMLYSTKGGPLKEILSVQQAILKQEEQSREMELQFLEMTREIEEMKLKQTELEPAIKNQKKEYNQGVREYRKLQEQNNLRIAEVRLKLEELTGQLPPEIGKLVEAAEKRYPLNFVAFLKGGACTGCRISVPSTLVREVKEGKALHHCDNCGRILINPF